MKLRSNLIPEIIGMFVTTVTGLISLLLPNVSFETSFVIFALGFLFTLTNLGFKQEILGILNERLEIPELVDSINDPEFREIGMNLVDATKDKLESMTRGSVTLGNEYAYVLSNRHLKSATKEVLATHPVPVHASDLYAWHDNPALREAFEKNVATIERGVRIERTFILNKMLFVDDVGAMDPKALAILKEQSDRGVKVFIVWTHQVAPDLIRNFVVYDEDAVVMNRFSDSGRSFAEVTLHKSRHRVRQYRDIYERLRRGAQSVEQIMDRYRPSVTTIQEVGD